jgi:hypothetical protein
MIFAHPLHVLHPADVRGGKRDLKMSASGGHRMTADGARIGSEFNDFPLTSRDMIFAR